MNGALRPYFPHLAPVGRFTGLKRMLLRSVYAAASKTTSERSCSPRLKTASRGVVVSASNVAQVTRYVAMNAWNAVFRIGAFLFVPVIVHARGVSRRARARARVTTENRPRGIFRV
jgi:hypothetical protein